MTKHWQIRGWIRSDSRLSIWTCHARLLDKRKAIDLALKKLRNATNDDEKQVKRCPGSASLLQCGDRLPALNEAFAAASWRDWNGQQFARRSECHR